MTIVGHMADMARHAGNLYRRLLRKPTRPIEKLEAEARHLHDVEQRGESGVTPFIAIGGLILFLVPIVLFMLGVAFAAYYLAA
jgi:hypothetical protein